jgi:hypothetical protein
MGVLTLIKEVINLAKVTLNKKVIWSKVELLIRAKRNQSQVADSKLLQLYTTHLLSRGAQYLQNYLESQKKREMRATSKQRWEEVIVIGG